MAKKKGVKWKVFGESIYHRDRDDRIQQAFDLIMPDIAKEAIKNKREEDKRVLDTIRSQNDQLEDKLRKAQ